MRQLLSLTTLFLISCASLPPAPQGYLCIVDIKNQSAQCKGIATNMNPASYTQVISGMNNWITVSPSTWANIQTYIGQIKVIAEQKCSN